MKQLESLNSYLIYLSAICTLPMKGRLYAKLRLSMIQDH